MAKIFSNITNDIKSNFTPDSLTSRALENIDDEYLTKFNNIDKSVVEMATNNDFELPKFPQKDTIYEQIAKISQKTPDASELLTDSALDLYESTSFSDVLKRKISQEDASLSNKTIADFAKSKITLYKNSAETLLTKNVDETQSQIVDEFSFAPNTSTPSSKRDVYESKIPNPLRNHNSYNYVITLGVLSSESASDPESYRKSGFKTIIAKTSGGSLDKRYQVESEISTSDNAHAEYYIEDLEIEGAIAPNPNTGITIGTSIQFSVTEPYSMGNFTQSVIGAAAANGFMTYSRAPFCLRIDFIGWDETGSSPNRYMTYPIYIPIIIVNIEFEVTGQGSKYTVTATALSEIALSDHVNQSKTPINAHGDKVHVVTTSGKDAVMSSLNSRIEEFENEQIVTQSDRFVICFPENIEEVSRIASGNSSTAGETTNSIGANGGIYESLKSFACDESRMNKIGKSELVGNHGEGSDQDYSGTSDAVDPETDTISRNTEHTAPIEKTRNYQTHQSEKITEIIEMVVNDSMYARENSTERRSDGLSEWYRIVTNVYIEKNPQTESQRGRPPMVYVYSVVPYYADESKNLPPSEKPQNTDGLKDLALKSYNYIYTGKNEDVLSFDINFRYAFINTALSNFSQNTGQSAAGTGNIKTANNIDGIGSSLPDSGQTPGNQEITGAIEEVTEYSGTSVTTSRETDIRKNIAAEFHNNIKNRVVDMVNAEIEILGDPFFLPQQTGNYVGKEGSEYAGSTTDMTMDYLQNDIFVNVKFQTPLDYPTDGGTVEFIQDVPQFSGLFSVWAVTNKFSGGMFTQVLKLMRRQGQTDQPTSGPKSPIIESVKSIADLKQLNQASKGSYLGLISGTTDVVDYLGDIVQTKSDNASGQPTIFPEEFSEKSPVVTINGVSFDTMPMIFKSPPRD